MATHDNPTNRPDAGHAEALRVSQAWMHPTEPTFGFTGPDGLVQLQCMDDVHLRYTLVQLLDAMGDRGDIGQTNYDIINGLRTCVHCGVRLHRDRGVWVDDTDGDGCSGSDDLVNENGTHEAGERS